MDAKTYSRQPLSAQYHNSFRYGAGIVVLLFFLLFLFLGFSRHWGYLTSINDLGVADQVVWGLLNGEFFLNTSQLNRPIIWLGFHFHPIYLLFVPFYYLIPFHCHCLLCLSTTWHAMSARPSEQACCGCLFI
jgi:uncharacterized membrane protein